MACTPAIESAFWDHWETAVLGHILARGLLEPDFGTLVACQPAIESAVWDHWETTFLGQILARNLLEPHFGTLVAWSPAIKSAFWDHWETAVLGEAPFWGCPEGLKACGTGFPSAFVVWDGESCAASSS